MSDDPAQALDQAIRHLHAGELSAAETRLREVLTGEPENALAHHALGTVAFMSGHGPQGVPLLAKAAALEPDNAEYHHDLAVGLLQTGRVEEARAPFDRALALDPGNERYIYSRAMGLMESGDLETATREFETLAERMPKSEDVQLNLGALWARREDPEKAIACFDAALNINRESIAAQTNKANALGELGRVREALAIYDSLGENLSDDPVSLFNYGSLLRRARFTEEAAAAYRAALARQPEHIGSLVNLGNLLVKLKDYDGAAESYDRAMALAPGDRNVVVNYCRFLERMNRLDEAVETAGAFLADNPDDERGRYLMATLLNRRGEHEAALAMLDELSPGLRLENLRFSISFQKGTALDDIGRHAEAFVAYTRGNQEQREILGKDTDPDRFLNSVRSMRAHFAAHPDRPLPEVAQADRVRLSFLVGFPRSGTTLTEAILASRPGVFTTEESSPLDALRTGYFGGDARIHAREKADKHTAEQRATFLSEAKRILGVDPAAHHVVDKNPLNIAFVGLIEEAFPEARILVALRDPRDVCLSCFMQSFAMNEAMINFTDLRRTAELYAEVMGLWLQYRDTTKLAWMEYRYEDLVTDFAGTTRRILDFVGEPWSKDIADFQNNIDARPVSTPSYRDIAKPVTGRSVGRWRRYEAQLAPMREVLAPFVAEFGYD